MTPTRREVLFGLAGAGMGAGASETMKNLEAKMEISGHKISDEAIRGIAEKIHVNFEDLKPFCLAAVSQPCTMNIKFYQTENIQISLTYDGNLLSATTTKIGQIDSPEPQQAEPDKPHKIPLDTDKTGKNLTI